MPPNSMTVAPAAARTKVRRSMAPSRSRSRRSSMPKRTPWTGGRLQLDGHRDPGGLLLRRDLHVADRPVEAALQRGGGGRLEHLDPVELALADAQPDPDLVEALLLRAALPGEDREVLGVERARRGLGVARLHRGGDRLERRGD